MSWEIGKLSDIACIISGYAFKSEWFNNGSDKIIRIGDLQNNRIDSNTVTFDSKKHNISDQFKIKENDILMALSGATVGKIAIAEAKDTESYINQRVAIIRGNSFESAGYLKYIFSGLLLKNLLTNAGGAAQPNLSTKNLVELQIPLPPISEQKRIAAILDKADEIRRKREQAIAKLEQLAQSIFVEMFGDITIRNKKWPYGDVSDFVAGFESGKSIVANDEDSDSKYKVLKVSAVTSLVYKSFESKSVPSNYLPPSSHFVKTGDLLFSRANTVDLIGATAYVDKTPKNLLLPDKIWRFVWHTPSRAHILFVRSLFQQNKFRQQISKRSTGTSGSMKNISQEKVLSIPVCCPPLALQEEFAKRINQIEKLKADNTTALANHNALFASLQQQAFSGNL